MNLWMAIPDSSLADEQTKREKSRKVSQIARACAIFGISRVYIYRDRERDYNYDRKLLRLLLEFMDTPQYLRRTLYGKIPELAYAGILHPLRTPHHKPFVKPPKIRVGEVRQAVAEKMKGRYYVDAGLGELVPLEVPAEAGKRITIRFTSAYPALRCTVASERDIKEYWGYAVKEVKSLSELLGSLSKTLILIASRRGEPLGDHEEGLLKHELGSASSTLLVYGSPNRGLFEILGDERRRPDEFTRHVINFFPEQRVQTVRLEEAILGSLSLLNYLMCR